MGVVGYLVAVIKVTVLHPPCYLKPNLTNFVKDVGSLPIPIAR